MQKKKLLYAQLAVSGTKFFYHLLIVDKHKCDW